MLNLGGNMMWKIYDALIEGIPDSLTVEYSETGVYRSLIHSGNTGIATNIPIDSRPKLYTKQINGSALRDIAELVKSWNFCEASMGMAAINAYYNNYEKLISYNGQDGETVSFSEDAFEKFKPMITGKKVALIGHFEFAVTLYSKLCNLSVLERNPINYDYPDSACEYILPNQDFVFITGMTFANKTLPRLLELSKNACVIMAGPSVPMTPILHNFGIKALTGFCVRNNDACIKAIRSDKYCSIYQSGSKAALIKE